MTTRTRAGVGPGKIVMLTAVLVAATGAYVLFGTPDNAGTLTDRGERGKIIRAEVEASAETHITLVSRSSVHGEREHVNATYSRSFGYDIHVAGNEKITVTLTSAMDPDPDRRTSHECVLRENGKAVSRQPARVRAGEPARPVTCTWTTTG